ncbi:hypothetical protein ACFYNO_27900 [Kitasatospora sp. NPDC006697]|uniref:hypothetical protein n=1 Tax=Kitasatospora sp. NPDC006697 TaxID=3364020 RepID=UPI0036919D1E
MRDGRDDETTSEILRRLARRPPTLVKVVGLVLCLAALSVAFVPAPFTMVPISLLGIPSAAWLIRRDRVRAHEADARTGQTEGDHHTRRIHTG